MVYGMGIQQNWVSRLDNTLGVALDLRIMNSLPETLRLNQVYPLEIKVSREDLLTNTSLSLNAIELSLNGMTESGLQGISYLSNPQRINLTNVTTINGTIDITIGKHAPSGNYTITPRITTFEKDNLTVSLSRPQAVILDIAIGKSNIPADGNQPNQNLLSHS